VFGVDYRKWTDWEVEFLRENWGKLKIPEIAKRLGRTRYAVRWKAGTLGLPTLRRDWSPWEMDFLKENYAVLPNMEIAKRLGRSIASVRMMARKLGLRKRIILRGNLEDRILQTVGKVYIGSISDLTGMVRCGGDTLYKYLRKLRDEGRIGFTKFSLTHRYRGYGSHELFKELSGKYVVWTDVDALIEVLAEKLQLDRNLPRYFKKSLTYSLKQVLPIDIFERVYMLYGGRRKRGV